MQGASLWPSNCLKRIVAIENALAAHTRRIENLETRLNQESIVRCGLQRGLVSKAVLDVGDMHVHAAASRICNLSHCVFSISALATAIGSAVGVTTCSRLIRTSAEHGEQFFAVTAHIAEMQPASAIIFSNSLPDEASRRQIRCTVCPNIAIGTWDEMPHLCPAGLTDLFQGGASVGDETYMLSASHRCMHSFDNKSQRWQILPSMPTWRRDTSISALNGKLYVIGGCTKISDRIELVGTNERFDATRQEWEANLPPMPTPRSGSAAASLSGQLFVAGGVDDVYDDVHAVASNVVEAYDPTSKHWIKLPALSCGRIGATALSVKEKFFVIGGQESPRLVECFDTSSGAWEIMTSTRKDRVLSTGLATADRIYVFGGYSHEPSNSCECFDISRQTWDEAWTLPPGISFAGVANLRWS